MAVAVDRIVGMPMVLLNPVPRARPMPRAGGTDHGGPRQYTMAHPGVGIVPLVLVGRGNPLYLCLACRRPVRFDTPRGRWEHYRRQTWRPKP